MMFKEVVTSAMVLLTVKMNAYLDMTFQDLPVDNHQDARLHLSINFSIWSLV